MNKYWEILLGRVIAPIIVAIILGLGTLFISKIKTSNWIGVILIRKRKKKLKAQNAPYSSRFFVATGTRYEPFLEADKFGLIWRIEGPAPHPYISGERPNMKSVNSDDIRVVKAPRCQNCKTELHEEKTFWGKYKFSCVSCGHTIKTKEDTYTLAEKVKKMVKREIEKKQER